MGPMATTRFRTGHLAGLPGAIESCFTLWSDSLAVDPLTIERSDAVVLLCLQRLARAMEGHVKGEAWLTWLGMRDSSKGVLLR